MFKFISQKVINFYAGKAQNHKLLVFSFHDVYQKESFFSKTSTKYELFRKKLHWINDHFDILPLDEAIELCRSGKLTKPTACLTFDDGFSSHVNLVLPLLNELGVSGAFYISSSHLNGKILWNDLLAIFYHRATPEQWLTICEKIRTLADLEADIASTNSYLEIEGLLKYLTLEARNTIIEKINTMVNLHLDNKRMLNQDEIKKLAHHNMICGSHTVNHPILSIETDDLAEQEIVNDLHNLAGILNKPTKAFAFPNGKPNKDFGAFHLNVLANNGVKYAVTTSPGYFTAGSDPLQIARVSLVGHNKLQFLKCVLSNFNFLGEFVECRGYEAKN